MKSLKGSSILMAMVFTRFQRQPCSGEAAFDEAAPVLDLLQAVPDDPGCGG
jgi:hypothetical protein